MNIQIGWGAFPSIALQVGAIQGNEIKCKGYCSKKRKNTPKISAGNGRKQSGEQIGKCSLRAALACISFFLEREGFLFLLTRESHFIPDQSAEYARDLQPSTPLLGRNWRKKHCRSASLYERTVRYEARRSWPVAQRGVYAEYWTSVSEGSSTIGTSPCWPLSKSGIGVITNVRTWKHSSPSPTANSHDYGIRDH